MSEKEDIAFLNYLSSLVLQTMIFLGEAPNPATNEMQKNLGQAKLLIDTLALLELKTKGNLTDKESTLIKASLIQLQEKYEAAVNAA